MLRYGALVIACLSFGTAEAAKAHTATLAKRMHKQPAAILPVAEWLDQPLQLVKSSESGSNLRGTADVLAAQQAEEERLAKQFDLVNHTAMAAQRAAEDKLAKETAAAVQQVDQQAQEEADTEAPVQKPTPAKVEKPAALIAQKEQTQFSAQVVSEAQDDVLPKPLLLTDKAVGAEVTGSLPKGLAAEALDVTQQGQLVMVRYQVSSKSGSVAVEQRFDLKFEPQGTLEVNYVAATGVFSIVVPGPKPTDTSLQHIAVKMKGSPPVAKLLSKRGLTDNQLDSSLAAPMAPVAQSEDAALEADVPPPPPPADDVPPPLPASELPPPAQDWVSIPVQANS